MSSSTDQHEHNIQTTNIPTVSPASSIPDRPPLRAPVTPYRLMNTVIFLAINIPKAVCAAKGQPVIAEDLSWAWGLVISFMYVHPRYVTRAPTLILLIIILVCLIIACITICPAASGSFTRTYPVRISISSTVRESLSTARVLNES